MQDLLDRVEVCRFFGGTRPINASTLYRGIKANRYPQPVHVGGSSRWLRSECALRRCRPAVIGRCRLNGSWSRCTTQVAYEFNVHPEARLRSSKFIEAPRPRRRRRLLGIRGCTSNVSFNLLLEPPTRSQVCISLCSAKVSILEHLSAGLLIGVVIERLVAHACAAFILFVSTWWPSARKRSTACCRSAR